MKKILFLAALLALASCARRSHNSLDDFKPQRADQSYRVQVGDLLQVKVWSEPQLSGDVAVREDGKFTMPLINDVPAEGKKLDEIGALVTERLSEFVPSASVTVSLQQSAPVRFFLSGAFLKPGEYRSASRVTFLQAVASGGGFAPFADDSSITLIRRSSQGEKRYSLDYDRVIDGLEPNPVLRDGDVIAVR